jgi:hypothetical protein
MQQDLHMTDTQYLLTLTVSHQSNQEVPLKQLIPIDVDILLQLCCVRGSLQRLFKKATPVALALFVDVPLGYHDGISDSCSV